MGKAAYQVGPPPVIPPQPAYQGGPPPLQKPITGGVGGAPYQGLQFEPKRPKPGFKQKASPRTNEIDYTNEDGDGGNCEDAELKAVVENALLAEKDNLDAARKIEADASSKFGGRFNSIVSDAEFAYVNWYGKRNCQLRVGTRHTLTWED
ncbi:Ground-like domain [Parelaphostrongylus tenuis]|uniref:Ground-like domain n=1 Tax=Parelaphostrongylus tenuis TaxID=148309 RepID=A0AAD5QGZ0_PARTN|nr:Ground-like domain [Parelaphostrongylus tenuis]